MNCGKLVKDKTDQDSWFSAKPIEVGNLSYIIAGTELWSQATLIDNIFIYVINYFCTYRGIVKILSVSIRTRKGNDEY
jgi:hypothetical protein